MQKVARDESEPGGWDEEGSVRFEVMLVNDVEGPRVRYSGFLIVFSGVGRYGMLEEYISRLNAYARLEMLTLESSIEGLGGGRSRKRELRRSDRGMLIGGTKGEENRNRDESESEVTFVGSMAELLYSRSLTSIIVCVIRMPQVILGRRSREGKIPPLSSLQPTFSSILLS